MRNIVEIGKGIYWIGEKVSGFITKNSYLLKNGEEGVLIDPGLYHKSLMIRIRKKWPGLKLKWIIYPSINFEHYPLVWELSQDEMFKDTKIIVHKVHKKFLEPLGFNDKFLFIDEHEEKFGEYRLKFIPVEILNFPGALFVFVEPSKILATGPLFSSFYRSEEIFATSADYFSFVDEFHQGNFISSRYLSYPLEIIERLSPQVIAPSTGLMFKGELINELVKHYRENPEIEESFYEDLIERVMEILTTSVKITDALPRIKELLRETVNIKNLGIMTLFNHDSPKLIIPHRHEKAKLDDRTYTEQMERIKVFLEKSTFYKCKGDVFKKYLGDGHYYLFSLKDRELYGALIVVTPHAISEDLREFFKKLRPAFRTAVEREVIYEKLSMEVEKYKEQVWFDSLTGLYNKNYLIREADRIFGRYKRYSENFSLVMMDIDDFKKINDTYGHMVGDIVLEDIGNILRRYSRSADILVRFGGEEFLAILPHTTSSGAYRFAEKIRTKVESHPIHLKEKSFKVTISAGVAGTDLVKNINSFDDLLKLSDKALYMAKGKGKNRTVVYSDEKGFTF